MTKKKDPHVALIIESGGIKSLSALPLLEIIERLTQSTVHVIASGAGATIACLNQLDLDKDEIIAAVDEIYNKDNSISRYNKSTIFQLLMTKFRKTFDIENAIYDETHLYKTIEKYFKGLKLEDFRTKIHIQVTDVMTGKGHIISSGDVVSSLCATNALYPFFPPVNIDNHWFVDGVFSSAVPVANFFEEKQINLVLMVGFEQNVEFVGDSFFEYYSNVISRTYNIGHNAHRTIEALLLDQQCDLAYIKIPFQKNMSIWDTSQLEHVYTQGEVHCASVLGSIFNKYSHAHPGL